MVVVKVDRLPAFFVMAAPVPFAMLMVYQMVLDIVPGLHGAFHLCVLAVKACQVYLAQYGLGLHPPVAVVVVCARFMTLVK